MTNDGQQDIRKPHGRSEGAEAAAKGSVHAMGDATRQGAGAAELGGRAASDAAQRNGEAAVEAMHRSSTATLDTARRTGEAVSETMRRNVQVLVEDQCQFVQDTAAHLEETRRVVAQAVQDTTENVRALMDLPNAARGGLQDLRQGVTGLFEEIVRINLRATQELFRLSSPSVFVELQQRFVREYLDVLADGRATLVRAARRMADETLRPLNEQIEQRGQARQSEPPYQHAAE